MRVAAAAAAAACGVGNRGLDSVSAARRRGKRREEVIGVRLGWIVVDG